ncbi:MAG: AEC family transporter, partial [Gammaproteobacteria bacterium]|nr:AEC family transporter [Gammaproteobacteria bacterium]
MSIFEIILPILSISFIGWALIKFNVISEDARNGISKLTFSILIPALLFKGMYEAREIEQLNILYLLSFYKPLIVTYFCPAICSKVSHSRSSPCHDCRTQCELFKYRPGG